MEYDEIEINDELNRFELIIDGRTSFLNFMLNSDNVIFLTHTEVPKALEGQGVGRKLIELSLRYIQDKGYKVVPTCSFVGAYFKRHPELKTLLAKR